MSAPIDVLAVMDREVDRAGGESYPDGRDLIEARAAVAELIEAVSKYRRSASTTNRIDVLRLDTALARFRGAA